MELDQRKIHQSLYLINKEMSGGINGTALV